MYAMLRRNTSSVVSEHFVNELYILGWLAKLFYWRFDIRSEFVIYLEVQKHWLRKRPISLWSIVLAFAFEKRENHILRVYGQSQSVEWRVLDVKIHILEGTQEQRLKTYISAGAHLTIVEGNTSEGLISPSVHTIASHYLNRSLSTDYKRMISGSMWQTITSRSVWGSLSSRAQIDRAFSIISRYFSLSALKLFKRCLFWAHVVLSVAVSAPTPGPSLLWFWHHFSMYSICDCISGGLSVWPSITLSKAKI